MNVDALTNKYSEAVINAANGEDIVFSAEFDIYCGKYCEGEVVITNSRVIVVREEKVERVILIDKIDSVSAVELARCGVLEATIEGETTAIAHYTMEHLTDFAVAERVITDICRGDKPRTERREKPTKCPNCGRAFIRNTQICRHCSDRRGIIRRLFLMSRSCWGLYACILVIFWLNSIISLAGPAVQKHLINDALVSDAAMSDRMGKFILWVALMAAFSLLTTVVSIVRSLLGTKASNLLDRDLRSILYKKVQNMPLGFIEEKKTGDLMNRINGDTNRIRNFVQNVAVNALNEVILLVCVAVALFMYNWKMALLILVPIPLVMVLINRMRSQIRRRYHSQWRKMDKMTSLLNDILNGIKVVKAFGQEKREVERFSDSAATVRDVTVDNEKYVYTLTSLIKFFVGFGSYFVLIYGGNLIVKGQLTLGELLQFTTYTSYLYNRVEWLSLLPRRISEAMTSAQRVFEVIDAEVETSASDCVSCENINGSVSLNDVTFGYKSYQSVIKDFSLDVRQGEMIGLVGHSGAGKSTVINLIMRLYDVDEGSITVDGTDIRRFDRTEYKSAIGVVLQESYLFSGSIIDNIRYARPDASVEECIRAAKIAHAHDFIVDLPNGYDTYVGEKGHRLSGGERQRVSIARAVLSDPKILILDEATASVDTETEQHIQNALKTLIRGRTTFAIAHRLSTLKNADRLAVLEEGQLAELGTHDELMEKEGIYARLIEAQRSMNAMNATIDGGGGGRGGRRGRGGPPGGPPH